MSYSLYQIPMFYGYPTTTDRDDLADGIKRLCENVKPESDVIRKELETLFPNIHTQVQAARYEADSQTKSGITPADSLLEFIDGKVRITCGSVQSSWC